MYSLRRLRRPCGVAFPASCSTHVGCKPLMGRGGFFLWRKKISVHTHATFALRGLQLHAGERFVQSVRFAHTLLQGPGDLSVLSPRVIGATIAGVAKKPVLKSGRSRCISFASLSSWPVVRPARPLFLQGFFASWCMEGCVSVMHKCAFRNLCWRGVTTTIACRLSCMDPKPAPFGGRLASGSFLCSQSARVSMVPSAGQVPT